MPDVPASLPERLADAEGELPTRLRIIADGDLRTMARDSLVGIHPDQHELHEWADLMDEAADVLTAAESAREAANFMAESWKATAEAEAEIGNERAAEARAALARAERAERFIDFVLKWRDRGPPHGDAETAWSVVSHHPAVGQRARDLATLAHPATAEET